MFSSAHHASQPTIIHPLLIHKYGVQERRVFIIPHRLKSIDESRAIIANVEKNFWHSYQEHKLQHTEHIISGSLMLTELLEFLIQVFQESDYIYNQDVFIGIDFQLDTKQDEKYTFDEVAEDADLSLAVRYYLQIANNYNPLLILNPFGSQAKSSYHSLTEATGETTLIGQTVRTNSMELVKNISDNIHGHCVLLDSINNIAAIKQLKLKTIIDSSRLIDRMPLEEILKSESDFIIS